MVFALCNIEFVLTLEQYLIYDYLKIWTICFIIIGNDIEIDEVPFVDCQIFKRDNDFLHGLSIFR